MGKNMELFKENNTEGYSESQLQNLNEEWEQIVTKNQLEEFTDEYNIQAKIFLDIVSKR
jgi:hypothetical protein